MELYLKNVIPRLKQFSQGLDRKEIFVDMPWVMIDENLQQQKYIFKRNGELVMSLNGTVSIGRWEYLASAKSLLIDRIEDKILLNQHFVDDVVMMLKMDGGATNNIILANERLLPDLDVLGYFQKIFYRLNFITLMKLASGDDLEVHQYHGLFDQNIITREGENVEDAIYDMADGTKFIIRDSQLQKVLALKEFQTNRGKIIIEHTLHIGFSKGDRVFQNGREAPDGKYKLSFLKSIKVQNGRIV